MPSRTSLPARLAARLPFFYGWIILACVCCAGFARQGPAVATLSIFISPMSEELGWSRTAISGAVSLGGILAAIASPFLGPLLDRHGARVMLCLAVATTGISVMLLSLAETILVFYLLFCIGRMNFAGPFDLGIYGAINSWFIERRAVATSIATVAQMIGLTAMPLIATTAIVAFGDWRAAWVVVGLTVLIIGFIPNVLFVVRRPEDVGLAPDGRRDPLPAAVGGTGHGPGRDGTDGAAPAKPKRPEPEFTRGEAMRTPAFWLLSLFTLLVYPVQAGISLHQAPHLIEVGIDPVIAATIVSVFSILSGVAGIIYGVLARRIPLSVSLMSVGALLAASCVVMVDVREPVQGYVAAAMFGCGIGGLLTMLPIAWADLFGRRSFGAIRGVALTVQVLAQAAGPLISGILRDMTGTYDLSIWTLAASAALAGLAALMIRTPRPPAR